MKRRADAKRAMALLVCVCLAAAFLLSAWFAAAHIHHNCTGNDCPVCMVIHRLSDMLRKLGAALMLFAAAFLAVFSALHGAMPCCALVDFRGNTPVSRKVQLNN